MDSKQIAALRELATLCQAADRPDVALDRRIGRAANGLWGSRAAYTSSFEAALTLIPSGWEWSVGSGRKEHVSEAARRPWAWCVRSTGFAMPVGFVSGATPALALAAAALTARADVAGAALDGEGPAAEG